MSVEQIQLLVAAVVIVFAVIGGYWALGRMYVAQFNAGLDTRFEALEAARREGRQQSEERFKRMEEKQDHTEADVRRLLIELPREYVRREDHIRFETVINAKLDAVSAKQDLIAERISKQNRD